MQLQSHIRERYLRLGRAIGRTGATRWHRRASDAHELLLMPPDLRTADPSFVAEVAAGQMGLAGAVADLLGRSVFVVRPPNDAWAAELHGFAWLRHLDANDDVVADGTGARLAARLFGEWLDHAGPNHPAAAPPEIVARRLLSWLGHAGLLMDPGDSRASARFLATLAATSDQLGRIWKRTEPGAPRVTALTALIEACLAFPGGDATRATYETELVVALRETVLPDGGLVCRNPAALLELMLDLIPLRQCYLVRGFAPPPQLTAALLGMSAMLRHLRLGDGELVRFNGAGATDRTALATVLAIDEGRQRQPTQSRESGFVRLVGGPVTLLLDAGASPPLPVSRRAAAGCLSFELSVGAQPVIVNAGAPGASHADWLATARATTRHSTLSLAEQSSAELRGSGGDGRDGSGLMAGPQHVESEITTDAHATVIAASHDGYLRRHGLVHRRTLRLDSGGCRLEGRDTLGPEHGTLRLARDVPFAVHFHLHPSCAAGISDDGRAVDIFLPAGQIWRFSADGAALSLEDSLFLATPAGPRPCHQITLRGACFGESELQWSFAQTTGTDGSDEDGDAPAAS